jgi:hypothetical protein
VAAGGLGFEEADGALEGTEHVAAAVAHLAAAVW